MDKQGIFKYALMSYLPQKYLRHASFEAQEADRLIIDFKSGRKYATERVSKLFAKTLSLMDLKDTIIVCIPASCQQTYTRRFRKFSENVCAKTGAINGFDHIKVIGKRDKVHISARLSANVKRFISAENMQPRITYGLTRTSFKASAFSLSMTSAPRAGLQMISVRRWSRQAHTSEWPCSSQRPSSSRRNNSIKNSRL